MLLSVLSPIGTCTLTDPALAKVNRMRTDCPGYSDVALKPSSNRTSVLDGVP